MRERRRPDAMIARQRMFKRQPRRRAHAREIAVRGEREREGYRDRDHDGRRRERRAVERRALRASRDRRHHSAPRSATTTT